MDIFIDGDRARLMTRPTPKALALLPRLEGRRAWLKGGGLSIASSEHNLALVREAFPDASFMAVQEPPEAEASGVGGRARQTPKMAPMPHQARALVALKGVPAPALFMEQGTGKTKVAIDICADRWSDGEIDAVLVVSKKGVHRQWLVIQLHEHLGLPWRGSYWSKNNLVEEKSSDAGDGPAMEWMAINFDALSFKKGFAAAKEFVTRHAGRIMIVGDETQEIKNPRAARSRAMMKLKTISSSPYRMALTGTPIAKDLVDEWAQLSWLNESILGIRYVTTFRAKYCIMGGFEGKKVVGHQNIDEFRRLTAPHVFRAEKHELGLLPKLHRSWKFDLADKQKKLIRSIKEELLADLGSGNVLSIAAAAPSLIKIQQVSNGFIKDEDGVIHRLFGQEEDNPRLVALEEVLGGHEGPAIIWARFREDIAEIAGLLGRRGLPFVQYHGGVNDSDRSNAVESFLSGNVQYFLSNPQTGGTGLNLQGHCRHAVYYSNDFNGINRWQSEDRIDRIGSLAGSIYTDLIADAGIDRMILRNHKRKKAISDMALKDLEMEIDNGIE